MVSIQVLQSIHDVVSVHFNGNSTICIERYSIIASTVGNDRALLTQSICELLMHALCMHVIEVLKQYMHEEGSN